MALTPLSTKKPAPMENYQTSLGNPVRNSVRWTFPHQPLTQGSVAEALLARNGTAGLLEEYQQDQTNKLAISFRDGFEPKLYDLWSFGKCHPPGMRSPKPSG